MKDVSPRTAVRPRLQRPPRPASPPSTALRGFDMFWLPALSLALFLAWPLTAADHTARDFGGIPNDTKDDTRPLQQAVDACQPGDRLVLEPGVYDLTSRITLAAKRDFEWVGQGAELVMRGYSRETDQGSFTLLTVRDCQNIRLRNFTVDQQPARHLDGTVVASAEDHFDLQVFPEFLPITGRERIGIMMNYRPDGTPDGRRFNTEKHEGVELLRPDTLRIRTPLAQHLKTGEGIVIRHNAYGPHVMSFDGCDGVTLSNVSLYAGGMGLAAMRTADLTLDHFRIDYRPGSRRLMSANADGVHLNMCRGRITLTNCVLRGMGDDCINIHGMWARVTAIDRATGTLRLEAGTRHTRNGRIYFNWAQPGEQLDFYDREITSRGTATVRAARIEGEHLVVTLDAIPAALEPDDLADNATCIPTVQVSGCTLGRNRARGFLCQVREALIENNTFESTSSGGLWILTDAHYWFESGPRATSSSGATPSRTATAARPSARAPSSSLPKTTAG